MVGPSLVATKGIITWEGLKGRFAGVPSLW